MDEFYNGFEDEEMEKRNEEEEDDFDVVDEFFENNEIFKELGERQRALLTDGSFVFVDNAKYDEALSNATQISKLIDGREYQDVEVIVPEGNFLPSIFRDPFSINICCDTFEISDTKEFSRLMMLPIDFSVVPSNVSGRVTISLFYDGVVTTIFNHHNENEE